MIRRIGLALISMAIFLGLLAGIQDADERIEAAEFQRVTQIQRGN